ncbi:MAG: Re/Si-specific NAD(P)(+) transhydrogenase subunit alpha [Pseudomonadota bacterium]
MKIAVFKETQDAEKRVAATPDTIKKFKALGAELVVETGAGMAADIPDSAYEAEGATIGADRKSAADGADILLKVQPPSAEELADYPKGSSLIASLNALTDKPGMEALAKAGINAFAMELMPRITRAQSMDILSSQSNLAGYKAVLDGCGEFGRALPMMMTAAGTIPAARVFVMGAGVAGLQAVATAKRLGAIVTATDVRAAAKEQVESLGGKFIFLDELAQDDSAGGYARELTDEQKKAQAELIANHVPKQDIVITTALIPGRQAPILVSEEMVASMKPGSVIVDLAVEQGGNVVGSKPGEVVDIGGVKIVGHRNVPSRLAADASALFAKNLLNFLTPFIDKESGTLNINWEDEVVTGTLVTKDGAIVHPRLTEN